MSRTVPLGLVACAAINRTILARLKRDHRFVAAVGADRCVHGACFPLAEPTTLFVRSSTFRATAGGIGQSTAGIEFLFPGSKGEFLVAVAAHYYLIGQGVLLFLTMLKGM